MNPPDISYQRGVPTTQVQAAAELYDEAFGQKFAVAVRDRDKRIALLEACLVPEFAVCALLDGKLVGLAGFQTDKGSLTSGVGVSSLFSHLGVLSGVWATCVFSLYEREPAEGELLMDGIAVHPEMRGRGVGGRLLEEVVSYARDHSCTHVRLDVIDANERARQLYERKGFREVRTESFPYLRWLLGFGGSTTMRLAVKPMK